MKSSLLSFFKSLKARIFFITVLCGILPTIALSVGFLHIYEYRSIRSDVSAMTAEADLINTQILTSGYLQHQDNEAINSELSALSTTYSGRIMVMDSNLQVVKDTYSVDEGRVLIWENAIKAAKGETLSFTDESANFITITKPIIDNDKEDGEVQGVLLINKSIDYIAQNMVFLRAIVAEIILIACIVFIILGVVFSTILVRPLKKMSANIDDITSGVGELELPVKGYTEAKEIADKFNGFMSQMKMIDDSRQEFVSNVSHELKTPLTSMKVLADSLNSMEDAPVELYKEFMLDIGNEIERENKVINDLLSLVKLDKSGAALNITAVNVNELLEQLMKRLKPIAEEQQVELVLESFRPVTAEVDEVKFSLAIMNLIENGIKYNNEGGFVHVSINSDHQYMYIRVEDSGIGIPEESLEFIFERFYRADKSHSREIGGTGLGLAITKSAIVMHHGEIKVHSTLGEGTTFDVRVPLSYIEREA